MEFQSTPSAWRETSSSCFNPSALLYFNPLPPHGGRLYQKIKPIIQEKFQSTPSAWRETTTFLKIAGFEIFQSTPSAWRETTATLSAERNVPYFNPLPPHGGRQTNCGESRKQKHFNPLPPHGGRLTHCHILSTSRTFQSTPSAWRETETHPTQYQSRVYFNPLPPHGGRRRKEKAERKGINISIHSLRMEGDRSKLL